MKRFLSAFLLISCLFLYSFGQNQEDIYKEKKGQDLVTLISNNYKPASVLSYNNARDELWGAVAKHNNDSLRCVYSGLKVYINPLAANPRTEAYNKGIDCEHTWPQSMGASTNEIPSNAKCDMHHLFPTRSLVNSSRGNLPFKEIADIETDTWYRFDKALTIKPTSFIDEYSEKDNDGWFEPREDHKGNVARALVYIYTIYSTQLDNIFWQKQMSTLYQWHYLDPVDAEEYWRNNFIASKQGNKNPFILDSTLFRRAYFPQYKDSVSGSMFYEPYHTVYTTFTDNLLEFYFKDYDGQSVFLDIFSLEGKNIYHLVQKIEYGKVSINADYLPYGILIYKIKGDLLNKSGTIYHSNSH